MALAVLLPATKGSGFCQPICDSGPRDLCFATFPSEATEWPYLALFTLNCTVPAAVDTPCPQQFQGATP